MHHVPVGKTCEAFLYDRPTSFLSVRWYSTRLVDAGARANTVFMYNGRQHVDNGGNSLLLNYTISTLMCMS
jgi:hypothetical protein